MLLLALLSSLALARGDVLRPVDEVELKSGKKLEGYVVREGASKLVLRVGSRDQEIEVADVASVRSANRTLAGVLDRLDALPAGEIGGRLDLARYCDSNALPGEADVLALSVLSIDAANVQAHELLEHVKRGTRWFVKRESRSLEFDDLVAAQADFKDPWVLRTSHYELMTNVALKDAVALALDLERYYRATYGLLAHELTLYEVTEPMYVRVYAEDKSYPGGAGGRIAYYDPQLNTAYVNAEQGIDRGVFLHEATHQLLHNTAERVRGGRGEVPGWLNEGLAEYIGRASSGEPGCAKFAFGTKLEDHFAVHRTAGKPYDLGRILTMATGDFGVDNKSDLKYAQAYTLVHFCLEGEGQRYRDRFFDFLRGVYLGKSSMSDFKEALGGKERELEKAWNVYVGRKP